MPELPEVETIRNNLRSGNANSPSLVGKTICGVKVLWMRTVARPSGKEFQERLQWQVVQEIDRRGKYLIFSLSDDVLLVHLGMSGDLLIESETAPIAIHYRLVLDFEDGIRLAFNDPRKFGRVWLVNNPSDVLASLGPEPLDETFTAHDFYQRLRSFRRKLKPLLMDQQFLAGMGNIYTDEALHLAHLHPLRLSHQVTLQESELLWKSIRHVLQEGIRRNGASIDWVYRGGDFQNFFRVYQRTGAPCLECGTLIQRIVVGQRGAHFCPICQKWDVNCDILEGK